MNADELISHARARFDHVAARRLYETPVSITAQDLYELAAQRWQEQMNAWLVEYEALSKNR